MTDLNNDIMQDGKDALQDKGIDTKTKGNTDDGGLTAENVKEMIKEATSGRDSQIGKLTNQLEALRADKEKADREKLTEGEQLKLMKAELDTERKKSKFRSLCKDKNLDADNFMGTALQMDENELEIYVGRLVEDFNSIKQKASEEAKLEIQNKLPKNQPAGDIDLKEIDLGMEAFKRGAGLN